MKRQIDYPNQLFSQQAMFLQETPKDFPLTSLPHDIIKRIMVLVEPSLAQINKLFAQLKKQQRENYWTEVKMKSLQDSFLSYLVKIAEQGTDLICNAKFDRIAQMQEKIIPILKKDPISIKSNVYVSDSLEKFTYIREWIKDQNFLLFFEQITYVLPEASNYFNDLDKKIEDKEKAKNLRSWMSANQELLSSIDCLKLKLGEKLTELPEEICLLTGLRVLNLKNHLLETIPDCIGKLVNLKELNLELNRFETFPESICQLKNLKNLYLTQNALKTISDNIGQLENLKRLDLQHNKLTTLPDSLTQLRDLQVIFLKENRLNALPNHIEEFVEGLRGLHLIRK